MRGHISPGGTGCGKEALFKEEDDNESTGACKHEYEDADEEEDEEEVGVAP